MNNSPKQPLSQDKINALLGMTSKKLGTDPSTLRKQLEQGNITDIVKKLGGEDAAQVNHMLKNPKEMEKLFNSPQVKDLINKLSQGKTS